ncbi:MAG: creatininase family protein [Nocardiopsis sp. BM-2018]|uniref:Creatinine amidohydrolase n=1 Tax=Nocardiopsis metallicus TaxID=179819 RepID=A0A840W228_9ACTN|nr:creatininase family protein [Nocardiopsis metallicus]MBB5490034.1 creatinine amidohydrolase [Nocardiopsis metallicus]QRN79675.1 MAG: creatininase family protein [Nocardiopsis sp. BM-2018]
MDFSDLLPNTTSEDEGARAARIALLPVGSLEQHGPHLPLTTDTVVASALAQSLADAYPGLRLLPPITFGCSHEHEAWPGTVSVSAPTLHAMAADIAESLHRAGTPKLVLVNGHGGNHVLANLVQASRGDMALFPGPHDWEAARTAARMSTDNDRDMHAGELETSVLLHVRPDLVRPGYEEADHIADRRDHLLTAGLSRYTRSGVVGQPSRAAAAEGRDLLAHLVEVFAGYLNVLDPQQAPHQHQPAGKSGDQGKKPVRH